jgi:hypothetical protein
VVDAPAESIPTYQYDDESKTMTLGFSDLYLVSTGGRDVFALNLNEWGHTPPFYLDVEDRQFALQAITYLVSGHGADLPEWVASEESEGRLTVLAERDGRYLVYSHDTTVEEEDEEADGDTAEAESAE